MLQLLLFYVFCPLHNETIVTYTTSHTHLTCATFLTRGPGGTPVPRPRPSRPTEEWLLPLTNHHLAWYRKPLKRAGHAAGLCVRGPRVFWRSSWRKRKEETNSQPATNIPRLSLISCLFFYYFFCKAKYIVFIFIAKHSHTTPKNTHTQHHAKHDKSDKNLLLYYQLNKKTANYQ